MLSKKFRLGKRIRKKLDESITRLGTQLSCFIQLLDFLIFSPTFLYYPHLKNFTTKDKTQQTTLLNFHNIMKGEIFLCRLL